MYACERISFHIYHTQSWVVDYLPSHVVSDVLQFSLLEYFSHKYHILCDLQTLTVLLMQLFLVFLVHQIHDVELFFLLQYVQ